MNPELVVLKYAATLETDNGLVWGERSNQEVFTPLGISVGRRDWHQILLNLTKEALMERFISRPWTENYKSITCYRITSKGREYLKELGL